MTRQATVCHILFGSGTEGAAQGHVHFDQSCLACVDGTANVCSRLRGRGDLHSPRHATLAPMPCLPASLPRPVRPVVSALQGRPEGQAGGQGGVGEQHTGDRSGP